MQKVYNFGSVLQSYSLKNLLTEMGNEVEFIDIDSSNRDLVIKGDEAIVFEEDIECNSNNITLRYIKKINVHILNRIKNKLLQRKQNELFYRFQQDILKVDDRKYKEYDLCVIGSDEVFNCLQGDDMCRTTQLFGNVPQAEKIITYAASCGFCTYERLSSEKIVRIKKAFVNISHFSVRDDNTKRFVELLSHRDDISEDYDPVVIGNFDLEIEKSIPKRRLPEKYCLVYAYPNRFHKKEEINEIKNFCKQHGLDILAIGMQQSWISDFRIMTPFELLYAFKNADFVITDTFHGAIFSAKYSNKYAIMIRESNRNKLSDLVSKLDISAHVMTDAKDLENIWLLMDDKETIRRVEQDGLQKTLNYFESALQESGSVKREIYD